MGGESRGETGIVLHYALQRGDCFTGWSGPQDCLDGGFGVERFGANPIEQELHGGIQPGERDGGEKD